MEIFGKKFLNIRIMGLLKGSMKNGGILLAHVDMFHTIKGKICDF